MVPARPAPSPGPGRHALLWSPALPVPGVSLTGVQGRRADSRVWLLPPGAVL